MSDVFQTTYDCVFRITTERYGDTVTPFMSALLELALKHDQFLVPKDQLALRIALGRFRAGRANALDEAFIAYLTYRLGPFPHHYANNVASCAQRAIEHGVPEDQVRALIALHLT